MSHPSIWPREHGACVDLARIRGHSSEWLVGRGFPAQVIRALHNYPEPTAATQAAFDLELHDQGLYRYAPDLEALTPTLLLQLLAVCRHRADWALWCNVELQESLIARNQSRDASSDSMGYWDELIACPFIVIEALPPYDAANHICRKISGAISGRLSVIDKVTVILADDVTLRRYPAHQRYTSFQTLFEAGP